MAEERSRRFEPSFLSRAVESGLDHAKGTRGNMDWTNRTTGVQAFRPSVTSCFGRPTLRHGISPRRGAIPGQRLTANRSMQ